MLFVKNQVVNAQPRKGRYYRQVDFHTSVYEELGFLCDSKQAWQDNSDVERWQVPCKPMSCGAKTIIRDGTKIVEIRSIVNLAEA